MKKRLLLVFGILFCISAMIYPDDITVLYEFGGQPDASEPWFTGLTYSGETIYGATYFGGANNLGAIFSVDTNGNNYTVLHSFETPNGWYPGGNSVVSGDTMYGGTWKGGANLSGMIYSMKTDGTNFTNLYNFGDTLVTFCFNFLWIYGSLWVFMG
ncbi:choice-of-anchor tandem repeat GloVer-containing protein, partial [Chlamydiota bacterium]